MLPAHVERYRDAVTRERLSLVVTRSEAGRIIEGSLHRPGAEYAIAGGIPRFCPKENYAESFGFQWSRWSTTQLDSKAAWAHESEERLFGEIGGHKDLSGKRVLEAGSGMGRFTELLADAGAEVSTFDYSRAIEANHANNARFENASFAQADIFNPPYELASFDLVLCLGVIQHTPSPQKAFASLVRFVRPGGAIVVDSYRLSWRSALKGKYWLRPIAKRLPPETLRRAIERQVSLLWPLTGKLHEWFGPRAAKVSWALAMADYRDRFHVDDETAREYAVLDTFDMLAPEHDRPATLGMVRRWFEAAGLTEIEVRASLQGVSARGKKPG